MNKIELISGNEELIDLVQKNEIIEKYGLIAILDALGTKNLNADEIHKFLENHFMVLSLFKDSFCDIAKEVNKAETGFTIVSEPEFHTFQDTLIIALEIGKKEEFINYLLYFLYLIQFYVAASFINHIMFRGAISYGPYFKYQDRFYFGEAINNAAQFAEKPDFIGVICEPRLSNFFDHLVENHNQGKISFPTRYFDHLKELVVKGEVPLKGSSIVTYTVTWPLALVSQNPLPEDNICEEINAFEMYNELMKLFNVEENAPSKYNNTNSFVAAVFEAFPDKLNFPREELFRQVNENSRRGIN
jgi:hypothetical protein